MMDEDAVQQAIKALSHAVGMLAMNGLNSDFEQAALLNLIHAASPLPTEE